MGETGHVLSNHLDASTRAHMLQRVLVYLSSLKAADWPEHQTLFAPLGNSSAHTSVQRARKSNWLGRVGRVRCTTRRCVHRSGGVGGRRSR